MKNPLSGLLIGDEDSTAGESLRLALIVESKTLLTDMVSHPNCLSRLAQVQRNLANILELTAPNFSEGALKC